MTTLILCLEHSEPAEYVGKETNTNKFVGFCKICVQSAQQPLTLIKEAQKNIDQIKNGLLSILDEQQKNNISVHNKIEDYLTKYKDQLIQKINILISIVEQQTTFIQKFTNQASESIRSSKTFDPDVLISIFEQKNDDSLLEKTKEQILYGLKNFEQKNCFFDVLNILDSYPYKIKAENDCIPNQSFIKEVIKCQKHNEEVVAINFNELIQKERLVCLQCISEKKQQFTTVDQAKTTWLKHHQIMAEALVKYENKLSQTVQILKNQTLTTYSEYQLKCQRTAISLEQLIASNRKFIKEQMLLIKNKKFQYYNQADFLELKEIFQKSSLIQRLIEERLTQIESVLINKRNSNIDIDVQNVFKQMAQFQKYFRYNELPKLKNSTTEFNYTCLGNYTIKQEEWCGAIAFNSSKDLVIVVCGKKIKVFRFNQGYLQLLQIICEHSDDVFCLQFQKNENIFASAGSDKSIKIWRQTSQKSWSMWQNLEGHTDRIICLVFVQSGDQIISGGQDKSIRFWEKNHNVWNNSQTIFEHQKYINGMSLNESESKLITCGDDDLILVIQQVKQKIWSVIQKIQTAFGCRLCFITDDLFSFQPNSSEAMFIFQFDSLKKEFIKTNEIKMKENKRINQSHKLFPQRFIKSKDILINKHKNYLNIIKRQQYYGEFILVQSVDFKEEFHYGTISDDGEYIITWDKQSKEIQVRQFIESQVESK